MTEELKEQIHERVYNIKVPTLGFSRRDLFNIAMEYAEPREKRIEELEETINKLREQVSLRYNLEDKITELKLKLEALEGQTPWKDIRDKSKLIERLSKATELIEDMYDAIPSSHSDYYKDVMERARQFLSEVEK